MQSKRTLPTVLLASMILVAVSAAAAWVAVGGLATATARALERMESALVASKGLADSTASSASELEQVVVAVSGGLLVMTVPTAGSGAWATGILKKMDTNVDGNISWTEFDSLIRSGGR
jgi:hypothetical protein